MAVQLYNFIPWISLTGFVMGLFPVIPGKARIKIVVHSLILSLLFLLIRYGLWPMGRTFLLLLAAGLVLTPAVLILQHFFPQKHIDDVWIKALNPLAPLAACMALGNDLPGQSKEAVLLPLLLFSLLLQLEELNLLVELILKRTRLARPLAAQRSLTFLKTAAFIAGGFFIIRFFQFTVFPHVEGPFVALLLGSMAVVISSLIPASFLALPLLSGPFLAYAVCGSYGLGLAAIGAMAAWTCRRQLWCMIFFPSLIAFLLLLIFPLA